MKYLRTFLLALQSEFISRANVIGWFLVGSIPSIALVLVWFAILGQRQSINGFTRGEVLLGELLETALKMEQLTLLLLNLTTLF